MRTRENRANETETAKLLTKGDPGLLPIVGSWIDFTLRGHSFTINAELGQFLFFVEDCPARLDASATARLLGFAEHDIQILMRVGKLVPLGDPAPNAPKWFAAIEMFRLAADRDWLNKATREVARFWRHKRERQANAVIGSRM